MRLFSKKAIPTKVTVLGQEINTENSETFYNAIREADKRFNDIDKSIDEITGTDYRAMTIQDWLQAMRSADVPWEGGYRSSWVKLFDIFQNMIQDAHVEACVKTILEGVRSKDFYIVDENGEKDDEATDLFKSKWFGDYINAILNVDLWGFGLIQLQDAKLDEPSITVREVNRKHVRPDLGGITKQQYDETVYKYWDKEPYKTWTIYNYNDNLGTLNTCVRWWIYKTEVARFWAKYNQLYGVPPVIAKTSLKDRSRKTNAIDMLKKWLSSRWMVIDNDDTVEQFSGSNGSGNQELFENFIRLADEQISKSLLGSTMVLDNGSSRSQSETHESNTRNIILSICRNVKYSADKQLIPRLLKIGFPIKQGSKLIWDNSEKLTMKERAEVVDILNRTYKVDESVVNEFVGIEVEEKEEVFDMPTIEDKYKNKFK